MLELKNEKDDYDNFLVKIQSYITYLTVVTIVAVIDISILFFIMLRISVRNDQILSRIVSINIKQYENRQLEISYLSDTTKMQLLLANLKEIEIKNEEIKSLSGKKFIKETVMLENFIKIYYSNYKKMEGLLKERGLDPSSGKLAKFYENDVLLIEGLRDFESYVGFKDGSWNPLKSNKLIQVDGKKYISFKVSGYMPDSEYNNNMLVLRFGGNGIQNEGTVYLNNIILCGKDGNDIIEIDSLTKKDLSYSFGKASKNFEIEFFNNDPSIKIDTLFDSTDSSWNEVALEIPLNFLDLKKYDRVDFDLYFPENYNVQPIVYSVALDGKVSSVKEFVEIFENFFSYNNNFLTGNVDTFNISNQINAFNDTITKMEAYYLYSEEGKKLVNLAKQKYMILNEIFKLDRMIVYLNKYNELQANQISAISSHIQTKIEHKSDFTKRILSSVFVLSIIFVLLCLYMVGIFLRKSMVKSMDIFNSLWLEKAANEAKNSFLSNISHEIRTPINTILGMDEMIKRDTREKITKERAAYIHRAGENLLGIVNDILDHSKLAAGKMTLIDEDYEVVSILFELENLARINAQAKKLDFSLAVPENLPRILYGDEKRIRQCITNLLTNAVKYTKKGSVKLNVSYEIMDDDYILLRIEVSDTGIGIKEDDLKKLCTPFERLEEIRNRTIEGTGLGLNIVKSLLALMDSKLEVDSEYERGSVFSFSIKQKVVSWKPIGNYIDCYNDYLKNNKNKVVHFTAPKAKILVVDDTAINLEVVKGLLSDTEIQIDVATSGMQSLNIVRTNRYDIIFIDYRMPGMDGIETLQAMGIMEDSFNKTTPCIALTANAIKGAREMLIDAGFKDYISKPIDSNALKQMIIKYLPEGLVTSYEVSDHEENQLVDENYLILKKLNGIDYEKAMSLCNNESILYDAVLNFALGIDSKSSEIEKYFNDKDYKNYCILVHSLKSTARIIGAVELSLLAEKLELCSDNPENNMEEIIEKTPVLLRKYREYKGCFAPVVAQEKKKNGSNENKELMDINELNDAYGAIIELAQALDMKTIEEIVCSIDETNLIPDSEKGRFAKLKELVRTINAEEIIELLKV